MTLMVTGNAGFTGAAAPTGPNAGYDPVMKFRGKLKKKKKQVKESRENPSSPSRLFQYKVSIPEVGETIIYASSAAELTQKLRLLINPRFRGDVEIERIMPAAAGKFFMHKRMNALRNVQENAGQQAQMKIAIEKKKVQMKKQELQKQLQLKTQQLKKQARAGVEMDATK